MKIKPAFFLLFILLANFAALAQTKSGGVSQIPAVEPFRIASGSSFAASTANGGRQIRAALSPERKIESIAGDFSEALLLVRNNYAGGTQIDYSEMTKNSITSMLRSLDPHSNYYDDAAYQNLLEDQQSQYFGIGASIVNYRENGVTDTFVTSTFPDSPAFRSNLRFGDKILAVDGESVSGIDSGSVRDKVRGRKGSFVRLTVERADSSHKIQTIEMRRNRVAQPSIPDAYMLRPGVGYVDMREGFSYTTAAELTVALGDLRAQGLNALVLDLRDNPGGILEQAVKVAEKFLQVDRTVLTQRGRFPIDDYVWKSKNAAPEEAAIAVLVNGGTASASEIVAGAFQDYDRAVIIGENTFGKGLVQSVINLPYGSGLTLTTAKYYTPSGRSIQRDYARVGTYDYFNHKTSLTAEEKNNLANKTLTGRKIYGGNGITPDESVAAPIFSERQIALLDPIFFFAREIAGGVIKGFENYRIAAPVKYGERIRPSDFPVTPELVRAFTKFAVESGDWRFSAEQIKAETPFIKSRLRYNLAAAAFGNVAANQVLIEDDPQIKRAIDALPRARQLETAANKIAQKLRK